jgi:hypothetical protein
MRPITVCAIATAAAVLGSLVTLAGQNQLQTSTVFEWATLGAKPTKTGARRDAASHDFTKRVQLTRARQRRGGASPGGPGK